MRHNAPRGRSSRWRLCILVSSTDCDPKAFFGAIATFLPRSKALVHGPLASSKG
jgi:hypothetical protein